MVLLIVTPIFYQNNSIDSLTFSESIKSIALDTYENNPDGSLFEAFENSLGQEGDIDQNGNLVGGDWAWTVIVQNEKWILCTIHLIQKSWIMVITYKYADLLKRRL